MLLQDIYNVNQDSILYKESSYIKGIKQKIIQDFKLDPKIIKNNESIKFFDKKIFQNLSYKFDQKRTKILLEENSNNDFSSFVGMHPIPARHGMTIGELAYMINDSGWLGDGLVCDLYIVKMQGWDRSMYFEDTGLKWAAPSPNIPDNSTSLIYNGMCLIEGTNLSEGRGTESPFMQFGAPWLDADVLKIRLDKLKLNGVEFNKVEFIPRFIPSKATYPKFKDEICNGLRIEIKDKNAIMPFDIAVNILNEIYNLHPDDFKFLSSNFIDKLFGSDKLRDYILSDKKIEALKEEWQNDQKKFKNISSKFLLY